jgi:S-adenosylmethionine synthetase
MARYVCKNVVASGLAEVCQIQLAYAIGVAKPVSVLIDTFGTARVAESAIEEKIAELVDLRPAAIIQRFDLRRPIYCQIAAYGHMGREDLNMPWEACDLVDELKGLLK